MRAMCGVHLNGWTGVKGLMPLFGLSETIFQVVMAYNVSCVEEGGWSCLERGTGA